MEYTQEELEMLLQREGDRRVTSALKKLEEEHAHKLEQAKIQWEQELKDKANLSATEQAEKKLKEQMDLLASRESELSKRENGIKATEMFTNAGVPKEAYEKLIGNFVTGDFETTKTNVEMFIDVFNTTKSGLETKLKTELSNVTPPEVGGSTGGKKFKDMTVAERTELKEKNPDAFYKEMEKTKSEFSF